VTSIHRDLRGPRPSYYWTENAKKFRSFRLTVRALGLCLTFAEASIGGGISSTSRAGTLWPQEIVTVAWPLPLSAEAAPASVVVLLELGDVGTRRKPVSLKVLYLEPRLWVPESANAQTTTRPAARRN
jgi:hypothetical protein